MAADQVAFFAGRSNNKQLSNAADAYSDSEDAVMVLTGDWPGLAASIIQSQAESEALTEVDDNSGGPVCHCSKREQRRKRLIV